MWTALAVYAVIWAIGLGVGIGGVWLPAAVTATYVGMHVFEITQRGHCYLSADSTAAPIAGGLYFVVVSLGWVFNSSSLPHVSFWRAWMVLVFVIIGAHLSALAYTWALTTALRYMYRNRIGSEREVDS
jgi:hypothetical protein